MNGTDADRRGRTEPEHGEIVVYNGGPLDGLATQYRGVETIVCTSRVWRRGHKYRLTTINNHFAFQHEGECPPPFPRNSTRVEVAAPETPEQP